MSEIWCWRRCLLLSLLLVHGTSSADPVWLREPVSPVPCYPGVAITLPWVYQYTDNPLIGITYRHGSYVILKKGAGQDDDPGSGYDDFVESVLDDYNAGIKITNCDSFPNGIESQKIEVVLVFGDSVTLAQTVTVSVLTNYTKLNQNVALSVNGKNMGNVNIVTKDHNLTVPPDVNTFPVQVQLLYDEINVFKPTVSFHGEAGKLLKEFNCQKSNTSGQCELNLEKDEAGEGNIYIVVSQYERDSDSSIKTLPFRPGSAKSSHGVNIGGSVAALVGCSLTGYLVMVLVQKTSSISARKS